MDKFKIGGIFYVKCFDINGDLKWEDKAENLVPNAGLNDVLNVVFGGSSATSPWYIGLKNVGTVAAEDTLASHAGWTENSNYAGDRKEYVEAAASGQSMTNAANVATFVIDTDTQTIAGAFLASVATTTTGLLISAADFTGGTKALSTGETLEVTYIVSASSS